MLKGGSGDGVTTHNMVHTGEENEAKGKTTVTC